MPDPRPPQSWTAEAARWLIGQNVSIYLIGRQKPMTGLTILQVSAHLIIARWNSSTHLIPVRQIIAIRYSPDAEPCRNIDHPLHGIASRRLPSSSPMKSSAATQTRREDIPPQTLAQLAHDIAARKTVPTPG